MTTLAEKFNGKLAVYSNRAGVGVCNFLKQYADVDYDVVVVTQSKRKFWHCYNNNIAVYLVFGNDDKSYNEMFDYFDGIRGYAANRIMRCLQFTG